MRSMKPRVPRRFSRHRPLKVSFDAQPSKHLNEQFLTAIWPLFLHQPTRGFEQFAHAIFSTHFFVLLTSAVSLLFAQPVYAGIPRGRGIMPRIGTNKNVRGALT